MLRVGGLESKWKVTAKRFRVSSGDDKNVLKMTMMMTAQL